jgi:hypothetical protein
MSKGKINMVSQLLRVSPVKPNFDYIKDVYEVCLERYLRNSKNVSNALNSINNGRKILISDEEVDTYIAFYGALHYYKLVEAFDALDMSRLRDQQLEIFSYGCGAATDTCSLISYCRSKQINLPFKKLTLIEPSQFALERGVRYIKQALSPEEFDKIKIKQIYKTLDKLEENDIDSESENLQLHIFSNVLDIEEINLRILTSLIRKTQKGDNYFICINPKNSESISRIDDFHRKSSNLVNSSNISINDEDITGKNIWMMKSSRYENRSIPRYHRIFKTDAT